MTPFAERLTGRIAEYQELLGAIDEAPGLTVLSCDPFSGTSGLLRDATEVARQPCVLVDARRSADTLDLAMTIADAAVKLLSPRAAAWWAGIDPPTSPDALRLARTLASQDIDLEAVRHGSTRPLDRLTEAMQLTAALANGPASVIIDHAGTLLWQEGPRKARELLAQLRAIRQDLPALDLVLVEFPDGVAAEALADPEHPMYRAGSVVRIRRARPEQFDNDLVVTRGQTSVAASLLRGCVDLAAGVPALTWRTVELADRSQGDPAAAALAAWRFLRRLTEPSTARHWDTLRRVHPLAQTLIAVIATGLRPHSIAANDKSVNDGLRTMRALGLAWQPEPRHWAIADPLLAAYARDHAPPWVARRRLVRA